MDFHDISDRWFLSEPLFFAALCYHKTAENRDMACPFRSGHFVLEYNPNLLDKMTNLEGVLQSSLPSDGADYIVCGE